MYLGRPVAKEGFRTFIYGPNGTKKLVNSWDEYESHMESGLWFSTIEAAKQSVVTPVVEEKPEPKKRERKKVEKVEPVEEVPVVNSEIHDGGEAAPMPLSVENDADTFEVKSDDFLSDARK